MGRGGHLFKIHAPRAQNSRGDKGGWRRGTIHKPTSAFTRQMICSPGITADGSASPPASAETTDRTGLERLIRYCARPPFAPDRAHLVGGRSDPILYLLPGPDLAGRPALRLHPRVPDPILSNDGVSGNQRDSVPS